MKHHHYEAGKILFGASCLEKVVLLTPFVLILLIGGFFLHSSSNEVATMTNLFSGFKLDQCDDMSISKTLCCSDPSLPVLGGIDLVSLYTQKSGTLPVVGSPAHSTTIATSFADFTFFFHSEENRDEFQSNPFKYFPAYGGFDSCGIGLEERSTSIDNFKELGPPVDLSKWEIINGKIYFFGGSNSRTLFLEGTGAIETGDDNWSKYYNGEATDIVFNTNCFRGQTYFSLVMGTVSPESCRRDTEPFALLLQFDRKDGTKPTKPAGTVSAPDMEVSQLDRRDGVSGQRSGQGAGSASGATSARSGTGLVAGVTGPGVCGC